MEIPDLPGYMASDNGDILGRRGRILTPQQDAYGGLYVNIAGSTRSVSKLVMRTFVGKESKRIYFRNGDKTDCRLANLCYGNPKHAKPGIKCSKGHLLVGDNLGYSFGSNRRCMACENNVPPVRELPEVI